MRAADLTEAHVGMVVLDIPGIVGWQEHLLLTRVEDCEDGTIRLDFRWNDDPSPANTRRGQFAIGQYVSPDVPVRVLPPPTTPATPPLTTHKEAGQMAEQVEWTGCPDGWCGPWRATADGWVCVDCGAPEPAATTVQWAHVLDDAGSADLYDTEDEARQMIAVMGGGLDRIETTTVVRYRPTPPTTPHADEGGE